MYVCSMHTCAHSDFKHHTPTHIHTHTRITDAVLRMLEQPLEILGTVIKPDGKSSNGDHGNQGEETSTDPAQKEADSAPEEAAKEETSETTEKVEGHDVSNDKLDRR